MKASKEELLSAAPASANGSGNSSFSRGDAERRSAGHLSQGEVAKVSYDTCGFPLKKCEIFFSC